MEVLFFTSAEKPLKLKTKKNQNKKPDNIALI